MMSSMGIDQQRHISDHSNSLYQMKFKSRPVLSDMSMVIPTLGRPILEQCLYYILVGDAWPGCLIVVDQGASQKAAGWLEHLRKIGIRTRHIIFRTAWSFSRHQPGTGAGRYALCGHYR
jgi:hypothetical protein